MSATLNDTRRGDKRDLGMLLQLLDRDGTAATHRSDHLLRGSFLRRTFVSA